MSNRKLNIAIFHFAFVYSGGGEKLVLEEARGLQKLGHGVTIFTPVIDRKLCFPDLIRNVKIKTFLPQITKIFPEHESFQILLTCVLAPFFSYKFRKFDVILAANQPGPWIAFWMKLFWGVPYVSYLAQPTRFLYPREIDKEEGLIFTKKRRFSFTSTILDLSKPITRHLDAVSIKKSDFVLANGDYMRNVLNKVYKIKTISCPAGAYPLKRIINYELRTKGKIKAGSRIIQKPYILITNRHFPQKKFEYAIASMPGLLKNNKDLKLVITGCETEYTKTLRDLIKDLFLEDIVLFLGLVSEQDLYLLYKNALAYLYTAPEEDFGMGIIEAMANGAPVVAWNKGGPSRIIEDGKDGLLADYKDLVSFESNISKIVSDISFADKIARNGWKKTVEKYDYRRHCLRLEKVMYESLDRKKI